MRHLQTTYALHLWLGTPVVFILKVGKLDYENNKRQALVEVLN